MPPVPRGQSFPRESGCSGFPTIFVTFPSFTCARTPHFQKQSSQNVGIDLVAVGARVVDDVAVEAPPLRREPRAEGGGAEARPSDLYELAPGGRHLHLSEVGTDAGGRRSRTGPAMPRCGIGRDRTETERRERLIARGFRQRAGMVASRDRVAAETFCFVETKRVTVGDETLERFVSHVPPTVVRRERRRATRAGRCRTRASPGGFSRRLRSRPRAVR